MLKCYRIQFGIFLRMSSNVWGISGYAAPTIYCNMNRCKVCVAPVLECKERRPKSDRKEMERGPHTPVVSKATGVKEWYAWEVR